MSDSVSYPKSEILQISPGGGAKVRIADSWVGWVPQKAIHDDSEAWRAGDTGTLVLHGWFVEGRGDLLAAAEQRSPEKAFTSIQLSPAARVVVDRAVAAVRVKCLNSSQEAGRCLELICADYLGGDDQERWMRAAAEVWAAVDDTLGEGSAQSCLGEWRKKCENGG